MGKTLRSVRSTEDDGTKRERVQHDGATPWRADRNERLRRSSRDTKRIERAERHAAMRDEAPAFRLGSTVRVVA